MSAEQPSQNISHAENELRPQSLLTGMNKFLASLEITFRRDPTNYRPRVNKLNSVKDKEQKGQNPRFEPSRNMF